MQQSSIECPTCLENRNNFLLAKEKEMAEPKSFPAHLSDALSYTAQKVSFVVKVAFFPIKMIYQGFAFTLDELSRFTRFHSAVLKPMGMVNPLTDRFEFCIIPTCVEKFLGEFSYGGVIREYGGRDIRGGAKETKCLLQEIVDDLIPKKRDEQGNFITDGRGNFVVDEEVTRGMVFEVELVNSDVFNALCLPGGKVVVTRGFIEKICHSREVREKRASPVSMIAAVLGHEISHALARHSAMKITLSLSIEIAAKISNFIARSFFRRNQEENQQRAEENSLYGTFRRRNQEMEMEESAAFFGNIVEKIVKIVAFFFDLSYSRDCEREADRYGIKLAVEAGYDKKGAHSTFHVFQELENQRLQGNLTKKILSLISTHPHHDERVENAKLEADRDFEDIRSIKANALYSKDLILKRYAKTRQAI